MTLGRRDWPGILSLNILLSIFSPIRSHSNLMTPEREKATLGFGVGSSWVEQDA
jgi:hypothetical protein